MVAWMQAHGRVGAYRAFFPRGLVRAFCTRLGLRDHRTFRDGPMGWTARLLADLDPGGVAGWAVFTEAWPKRCLGARTNFGKAALGLPTSLFRGLLPSGWGRGWCWVRGILAASRKDRRALGSTEPHGFGNFCGGKLCVPPVAATFLI